MRVDTLTFELWNLSSPSILTWSSDVTTASMAMTASGWQPCLLRQR